jgi:putative hydrolase of the HAD superfamily
MASMTDRITTLIFDVDDTLYDINTKFTETRNTTAVCEFMVQYLHFPDVDAAKIVRDEYFERYHATAKGLTIAELEGRFPPIPKDCTISSDPSRNDNKLPRFDVQDLSNYWATQLDYSLLGGVKTALIQDLMDLREINPKIRLIGFSNGPRKYVIRVLQELGLWETIFTHDRLFAVDDVLPYCKPEKEAFEIIFTKLGGNVLPQECIMIEDSMKNIRAAKELGMKTIHVSGAKMLVTESQAGSTTLDVKHLRTTKDASVDVSIETIEELRDAVPGLWLNPSAFQLKPDR